MDVPKYLISLINLYGDSKAVVRLDNMTSNRFGTLLNSLYGEALFRRHCSMSMKNLDVGIITANLDGFSGGVKVGGRQIISLRYADHFTLCADYFS